MSKVSKEDEMDVMNRDRAKQRLMECQGLLHRIGSSREEEGRVEGGE